MMPPIVDQAAIDADLPDVAFRVLVVLAGRLDLNEYRPQKHEVLALVTSRKRQTIAYALRQLEDRGYIRAGVRDPLAPIEAQSERPLWYRLVWSREVLADRPRWVTSAR